MEMFEKHQRKHRLKQLCGIYKEKVLTAFEDDAKEHCDCKLFKNVKFEISIYLKLKNYGILLN